MLPLPTKSRTVHTVRQKCKQIKLRKHCEANDSYEFSSFEISLLYLAFDCHLPSTAVLYEDASRKQ